jgi:hypothetical protein
VLVVTGAPDKRSRLNRWAALYGTCPTSGWKYPHVPRRSGTNSSQLFHELYNWVAWCMSRSSLSVTRIGLESHTRASYWSRVDDGARRYASAGDHVAELGTVMVSLEGAHDGSPEGNEIGPTEGVPVILSGNHGAMVGTMMGPNEGTLGASVGVVPTIGAMGVGTPICVDRCR